MMEISLKGGYLDFSHLVELKKIYITEIYMKNQYKSLINMNHNITIQFNSKSSNLQVKRYMSNQQFIIFHCDRERFLFDSRGSLNVQIELSSSKRHCFLKHFKSLLIIPYYIGWTKD